MPVMDEQHRTREEKSPEPSPLEFNLDTSETRSSAFACGYCRHHIPDGEAQLYTLAGGQRPYHSSCLEELQPLRSTGAELEQRIAQGAKLIEKYDSRRRYAFIARSLLPEITNPIYKDQRRANEIYQMTLDPPPVNSVTAAFGSFIDLFAYSAVALLSNEIIHSVTQSKNVDTTNTLALIISALLVFACKISEGYSRETYFRTHLTRKHAILLKQRDRE